MVCSDRDGAQEIQVNNPTLIFTRQRWIPGHQGLVPASCCSRLKPVVMSTTLRGGNAASLLLRLFSVDKCELTVCTLLMFADQQYPKSGVLTHPARLPCITRSALSTCKVSSGSAINWPRKLLLNYELTSALVLQFH